MNRKEYLEARKKLMDEAQQLISAGKVEEANAKMDEVKKLDDAFEAACKAQANFAALQGRTGAANIQNMGVALPPNAVAGESITFAGEAVEDMYDSVEYRRAFMANVIKGAPIPARFQASDDNTKTTDVATVIPTTIMEKIIEKMEAVGMILPLVTNTAYKGGMSIPNSTVKPVATWVTEGSGSDKQKKTTGSITFGAFKLRCAISVSLETDTMALPIFEATFVKNMADAMTKALEQAIISGSGSGQPSGILHETVVSGQNVDVAKAGKIIYDTLINAEGALPLEYEQNAVWCMTKKTFMKFIGIQDAEGQPIARTNYGINGRPERTLLGRQVILNNYVSSYADTVQSDTVVAFLFNFADYVLNTNYQITVKQYEDYDTDDMVKKAIMLVDGKVVDKNSLVTVTKKAA